MDFFEEMESEIGQESPQHQAEQPKHQCMEVRPTQLESWQERTTEACVRRDIGDGCRCGCSVDLLTFDDVLACRKENCRRTNKERSDVLERKLAAWVVKGTDGAFSHVTFRTTSGAPCCLRTFAIQQGFHVSQVYRIQNKVATGQSAWSPDYGGARSGAGVPVKNSTEESVGSMMVRGFFHELCEVEDRNPTSRRIEVDAMTDGEFYTLFAEEEHETGTPLSTIPRLTTFTNMWHEEFPDVSLRVMKTVSGKDRVAMILKDLIRQTSGKHIAAERRALKTCLKVWRESMRGERLFYYRYRLRATRDPEACLSMINDGATQDVYQVPRFAKYDHQRDCLQVKLVASIVHGTVLVFFLVMPTVKDDTNLQCHVCDRTLHHAQSFRKKQGLSESFPPEARQQIDGVGTNWGSIHFAHFEHLAREHVFEQCDVARQPVGCTHEDVDGVFGNTSPYIRHLNVLTPDKLEEALRVATQQIAIPVVIEYVDVVLDYIAYYKPHVDPKLSGYSYSHKESGYHLLSIQRSPSSCFSTTCHFQKYQQNPITLVDVNAEPSPRVFEQSNPPEQCSILLQGPPAGEQGPSTRVPPVAGFSWEKVLKDVNHVLQAGPYECERRKWVDFVTERRRQMHSPSTLPVPLVRRDSGASVAPGPSAVPRVQLKGRIKSSLEGTPTESELRRLLAQSKSDLATVTAAHDSLVSDNETLISDNNAMIDEIRRLRLENKKATDLLAAERVRTAHLSAHLANTGLRAHLTVPASHGYRTTD